MSSVEEMDATSISSRSNPVSTAQKTGLNRIAAQVTRLNDECVLDAALHILPSADTRSSEQLIMSGSNTTVMPQETEEDMTYAIPALDDMVLPVPGVDDFNFVHNNLNKDSNHKSSLEKVTSEVLNISAELLRTSLASSDASYMQSDVTDSAISDVSGINMTKSSDAPKRRKKKKANVKSSIKTTFSSAILQYIKDRLEGHVFSGWLEERQRLETVVQFATSSVQRCTGQSEEELVSGWRDVVEVDSCEHDLIRQLDAVLSCVPGVRDGKKWINIQPPGLVQGYLLWLMPLIDPQPPGHYWFRIESVSNYPDLGLQLTLKVIRAVGALDVETAEERARRITAASAAASGDLPLGAWLAWQRLYMSARKSCTSEMLSQWASEVFRPSSIAYGIKTIYVVIISIVVGLAYGCREAARLLLLFMREFGALIDKATPAMQIVLAFVEKIIGGFFLLLAMIYRDIRRNPRHDSPPNLPTAPLMRIADQPAEADQQVLVSHRRRHVAPDAWQYK